MKVQELLSGNVNNYFASICDINNNEVLDCTVNSLRLNDGNNNAWKNALVTSWEVVNKIISINVIREV